MSFKKILSFSLVSLLLTTTFTTSVVGYADAVEAFYDLSATHLNLDAINALKERDVLQGYEDGSFRPENRINRAEMVKIIVEDLYEASEIQNCLTANPDSLFNDVAAEEWYAPYICIAKRDKIVEGYTDGTFQPAAYINFVELSKILNEALHLTSLHEEGGLWYEGYVRSLALQNAIPSTVESFDEDVTRGEMSEMMWRLSDKVTDKVSGSFEELNNQLPQISSCDALVEKLEAHQDSYFYDEVMLEEPAFFDESMDTSAEESVADNELMPTEALSKQIPLAESSAESFSETNVQVNGVDEADIVKNDGKYIYLLKGDHIKIVQAYPALAMSETASLVLGSENFNPEQMFLNGEQLIIIGYGYDGFIGDFDANFSDEKTTVYILDITDRSKPTVARSFTVDGYYNTARRIGDNMYLVLNQYVSPYSYEEPLVGSALLPQIQYNTNAPTDLVKCTDIQYLPGYDNAGYTNILSFSLTNLDAPINSEIFLGDPDTVYMSQNNLYIAQQNYDYLHFSDWNSSLEENDTNIFKFQLEGPTLDFNSVATVPGYPLNQFAMDEHDGNFRIATTIEPNWQKGTPSLNGVYIFDENMNQIGALTNLAPGEDIYSTRFLGDRLYLVTFEQIDPLFVIDLANPTEPKVLGELKIPGYSTYLHPYDENHIIGFGEDVADPNTPENETSPAWQQGFKMALFDVSDPTKPIQQFSEVIGDRGTTSDLLYNHKALLFEPSTGLLAFPIQVATVKNPEQYSPDELQWTYGDTTFQGAYVYKLDLEEGFQLQGKITHYDDLDFTDYGLNYNLNKEISRIIRMDDILYTISESIITAVNKDTVQAITNLILE